MYIAINLIGGALFVVGLGAGLRAGRHAQHGRPRRAHRRAWSAPRAALVTAASMVLLVVFALKAAAFPLFFWLPDSYPVVPAGRERVLRRPAHQGRRVLAAARVRHGASARRATSSPLEILLVAVGLHDAARRARRALPVGDPPDPVVAHHQPGRLHGDGHRPGGRSPAWRARRSRRRSSTSSHHIVVKSSLFLLGRRRGAGHRLAQAQGDGRHRRRRRRRRRRSSSSRRSRSPACRRSPGFLSKLLLVRVGLQGGQLADRAVAVATSFLTLLSMMKIWSYAFWGAPRARRPAGSRWRGRGVPVAALVRGDGRASGCGASRSCGSPTTPPASLTEPAAYVEAVLGRRETARGAGAPVTPMSARAVFYFLRYLVDPRARDRAGQHQRDEAGARPARSLALGLRRGADGGAHRPRDHGRSPTRSRSRPGTITVHVDPARRMLVIHAIDIGSDPDDAAAVDQGGAGGQHPALDARRRGDETRERHGSTSSPRLCLFVAVRLRRALPLPHRRRAPGGRPRGRLRHAVDGHRRHDLRALHRCGARRSTSTRSGS